MKGTWHAMGKQSQVHREGEPWRGRNRFQTLSWGIFLTFQTRGELWNVIKINCNWELDAEWRQRSPSACWAVLAINHKITGQNLTHSTLHYWIQMPSISFNGMQRHWDAGIVWQSLLDEKLGLTFLKPDFLLRNCHHCLNSYCSLKAKLRSTYIVWNIFGHNSLY